MSEFVIEKIKCNDKILIMFSAQEMLETDFSLLIGLSVALAVFLLVTVTSIKLLRSKGRSPSMYTMTNLSKFKKYSSKLIQQKKEAV